LAEEGRLLASAHRLVQAGQGSEALRVLGNLKQRYPRSVLSQEREVLTIEALAATGDLAAARALTQKFLARHPQSPHASRLERFSR
jgi:outer membrane protein assembly factor BamD (BamD/ComL family)